jgi:uncharacterized protein YbjT (DUF2867 family)
MSVRQWPDTAGEGTHRQQISLSARSAEHPARYPIILDYPAPHIGEVYNLTGSESADLGHYAQASSDALGRTIRYRDVPHSAWTNTLREAGVPAHLVDHLTMRAELHTHGRYDRDRRTSALIVPEGGYAVCVDRSILIMKRMRDDQKWTRSQQ